MVSEKVKISPILDELSSCINEEGYYHLCWIQDHVRYIEINNTQYRHVSNSVFFLTPDHRWTIFKNDVGTSSGYVLYLPKSILNHPTFKNLHITQVRLFKSTDEIPKINLAPGIEKRVQSILEMLDELISTNLAHKEEAILSLLNTFFMYCDGKCNIKSVISDNNAKATLVYKFKKSIDQRFTQEHEVSHYANLLNVSSKYLNECVKDVLHTNAKNLIDEQLIMRSRHILKFTDKSVKEICYELGFSAPDYFSYFLKKHTGMTPSQIRKS
ncbi:helix-turn-helix domain-containing protein [uncultured Marivirga sp.]|uniref:helix-turn-helix domain-containing protein n=1 Tax=uncultured Marivirga sp. TaxID=1123707 RepID=UPI0030EF7F3A|tara:strand:+ start:49743 stop:50552 length:810 start_codon:yes stop_codon:yes gene_type:complete